MTISYSQNGESFVCYTNYYKEVGFVPSSVNTESQIYYFSYFN